MTDTTRSDGDRAIAVYLDDLARMLSGDPAMRAEVLGGVSEHIEAALAARPGRTGADVDAVLAELGPPEAVAAAALGDGGPQGWAPDGGTGGIGAGAGSGPAGTVRAPAPRRPAALDRTWVPPVVGLLLLAAAGVYLLVLGGLAMFAVTGPVGQEAVVTGTGAGLTSSTAGFHAPSAADFAGEQSPLLPPAYDAVWMVVVPLPLVGLPWLVASALLAASSLWTTRQKWAGVLLLPALVVLAAVALTIALTVGAGAGRTALLAAVVIAAALAVVRVVGRVWAAGAHRARELATAPGIG